jgi:hypothetical protein
MFAYFLTFEDHDGGAAPLGAADTERLAAFLKATPGLRKGLVFTPERAHDPYADDGPSPPLALELYFDALPALEAALAPGGHLQRLAEPLTLPGLAGAHATQQAMVARSFPVPNPRFETAPGALPCTYLVHYPGAAQDLDAWLAYYIAEHPRVMARFPGIREIEICTRLDWCGFLPWPRVHHMQRNKVVFDSAAALTAALNSPVREEMRADFAKFPPFTGGSRHHALATLTILP